MSNTPFIPPLEEIYLPSDEMCAWVTTFVCAVFSHSTVPDGTLTALSRSGVMTNTVPPSRLIARLTPPAAVSSAWNIILPVLLSHTQYIPADDAAILLPSAE